jgi:hypothetical protein
VPRKVKKRKATSVIAICITAGFFLGIGLGVLMNAIVLVLSVMLLAGGALGYYIDRRNGISYQRKR